MERMARGIGMVALGLASADLLALHLLPARLHATTGALIPYHPWNFLSEFARTDYGPLMTICFFLLALSTLATATMLRRLRREAILFAVAGIALILLGYFPTDLVDFTHGAQSCGMPGRIEPCTFTGRIHNPLSTLVFVPLSLGLLAFWERGRRESQWRTVVRWGGICGMLSCSGIVAATFYLHAIGWHGIWWTGLMQRSLVFPAILWMAGVLFTHRPPEAAAAVPSKI